jgi:type I restriction enzyme S subunit
MSEDATLDEFVEDEKESREFVETAAGNIPADWDTENVEKLSKLRNGKATDHTEIGDQPYLVYGSNGPIGSYSESNFDGGLIFGRVGAVGEVERVREPVWVSDNAIQASVSDRCNTDFLYYFLSNKELSSLATKTAQPLLNQSTIGNVSVPFPSLPEQRKIATVLYTVDRLIKNANEIETQLQRVKKGTAQRLFTYGIKNEDTQSHHIGDFPQSWEFNKVSNLADIERGNTPRTSHDEYYGGDITWVTPDDLSDLNEDGNGKYISDSGRKLTPEGVESSSLTIVEPDSIMFTSRSYGIGRTAICTVPAATNQGITAFECDTSLDTEFFYYYLNYIMDYVVSISGGSTFPEISKSATGKIDVPVPEIDEQEEIASILSQFDEQILHNREVLNQIKRLKRGLQQDLLSGTVRTTDTNIEVPDEIAQHG